MSKKILGLDLGIASIGWALVEESKNESSKIIKLGVRVNPLTTNEKKKFEEGKAITTNSNRTKNRSARRNLQRFKLRRDKLIKILLANNFIDKSTALTEIGNHSTYQTLKTRAKAATEQVSLESLARIFLSINKKRGYKSSRKIKSDNDGKEIDNIQITRELHEKGISTGQYALNLLEQGQEDLPDFYSSDLLAEFNAVWNFQKQFYPSILTDNLYKNLQGKSKNQTWDTCKNSFKIEGIKLSEKGFELKKKLYQLRVKGLSEKLELEYLAKVLQEINNNLKQSNTYLGKISNRSKELCIKGQTVGEYLYNQLLQNKHTRLKEQIFYRNDYIDEFEQIWETQAKFYPQLLTPSLKKEILDATIFYQRKLKSQKKNISFCQFESSEQSYIDEATGKLKKRIIGRKVIAKSSPLFQVFSIWQNINSLRFENNKSENKEIICSKLDPNIRNTLFEELNLRDNLKPNEVLKILKKPLELNKLSDWKCNFKEIKGNSTQSALLKIYQSIAQDEGYGHDWDIKSAKQIVEELKAVFKTLKINPDIVEFNTNLTGNAMYEQPACQLWHLLYAAEDDIKTSKEDISIYGKLDVNLKKKLTEKFGFSIEYAKKIAQISFEKKYGNLSTKAIKKILPHLKSGLIYSDACKLAGYNHSKSLTAKEKAAMTYKSKLELLKKNSLRSPVVEKILNQMVNLINQLIDTYGKPDEIRIELARELKKSIKNRKLLAEKIEDNTKKNNEVKNYLCEEYKIPHPTKSNIERYKLYQELKINGYKELFKGKCIPEKELFNGNIEIEHIIPKSLLFDDSFSNKTLTFRSINKEKNNRTALDYISEDYNSDLESFKERVIHLHKEKQISKIKRDKLLMTQKDIPDGFIDRDLRNSQYIAKKANEMLKTICPDVVATSGSITAKLRSDWNLINVMKELNFYKYKNLELIVKENRFDSKKGLKEVNVIKGWSKRDDHRHHAMDALTIAFTTHNHIQHINYLSARKNEKHKKHQIIKNIENNIFNKKENKYIAPMPNFREEAKKHIKNILVSIKNKNKVVTVNKNIIKSKKINKKPQITLTPRGKLHEDSVYGVIKTVIKKSIIISKKFTLKQVELIVNKEQKELVKKYLEKFKNDPSIAFNTQNLKKEYLSYKGKPLKRVQCFYLEDIFSIRTKIKDKNFKTISKIEKIVDPKIRQLIKDRLSKYNNEPEKAFSDLDKNPIWLNKEKGICIKKITIKVVANTRALHHKKNHFGQFMLDKQGEKQAVDYVKTGNNHHVAIYKDDKGKLRENIVSFYEAVIRVNKNLPIVDKSYNQDKGWQFLFTLKQNEMFVFPEKEFNPADIDLLNPNNAAKISEHLFRVQKISTKNYHFRLHSESHVNINNKTKGKFWKRITTPNGLANIVKVRINHIGKIVQIGEYD